MRKELYKLEELLKVPPEKLDTFDKMVLRFNNFFAYNYFLKYNYKGKN